eukprot:gnl/MRDRNA2_/MRDRNA2_104687_c0_seq1.p1 gnl/MRDRNA2_/MRDRNA2_104687_c0~~gnl/MRDRNA2_/MRDRNA2_104687_c0_seq1.p1  ORF type:complete len:208 (-),score=22.60 gnl/MRDRNA2_/MRDRNA2_104687_c0_seq1:246-776(-)
MTEYNSRDLLEYKMDNKLWENRICNAEMSEVESTTDAGSSSSTSSANTSSDNTVGKHSRRSTSQYPQKWRVVHRDGAVVRSKSCFDSKKLGVVRQHETLVVIGAEGSQLKIVNPDFSWARGWVSASTADGLVILECISQPDQFQGNPQSTRSRMDQSYKNAQSSSFMERFFAAFSL